MIESTWSPSKKKEFRRVLEKVAYSVASLGSRGRYPLWSTNPDRFVYIDLYAGDGGDPGGWGSPVIAIEVLNKVREQFRMNYDIHLYENNQKGEYNAERLNTVLGKAKTNPPKGCTVSLYEVDNNEVVNLELPENSWGLVYADPYGGCGFVPLLSALSATKPYQNIDFLVDLNPASIKRENGRFATCEKCKLGGSLDECLGSINKKYVKVREPDKGEAHSRWQWTMTFLSNNKSLFDNEWKKQRWHTMADSVERLKELAQTNGVSKLCRVSATSKIS